ncbi:hypothetical protein TRAPUB_647 [Trametes pubescens]|uniref:Uncharacterized protein n=1 Tax=Trametes pubescens TaxID=154538 RepID=A0A1M2VLH6_TRAPU|nr:hypothetical protein TRAPUB_647 [Trametes pubescens]
MGGPTYASGPGPVTILGLFSLPRPGQHPNVPASARVAPEGLLRPPSDAWTPTVLKLDLSFRPLAGHRVPTPAAHLLDVGRALRLS